MKTIIAFVECILIFVYCFIPSFKEQVQPQPTPEIPYTNLGIPLAEHYPDGIPARTPWDLAVFDNKLFVAAGDYDANSGPVPIYYYDLTEIQWKTSGTVADEQIEHFKIIDGTLMAPGSDPRADWEYGNIYVYNNEKWITMRNIPGGIHQLDLIEHQGDIFAGLGVLPGQYPIAVSKDSGKTFQQIVMYKDGTHLDTSVPNNARFAQIRVYDLFTLNGELFAYYYRHVDDNLTQEIYRYENDGFYYHCDFPKMLSYKSINYRIIDEKTEYDGKLYFTTGNLYVTSNLKSANKVELEKNSIVTDIQVLDNTLYVLTSQKLDDGTYRTALWCRQNGQKEKFRELFYFRFPCPAQCFTHHNGTLYFGMGDGTLSKSNPANGTILAAYVLG